MLSNVLGLLGDVGPTTGMHAKQVIKGTRLRTGGPAYTTMTTNRGQANRAEWWALDAIRHVVPMVVGYMHAWLA